MATGTDTATRSVPPPTSMSESRADPAGAKLKKRAQATERRRALCANADLRVCVVGLGYIGLPTASLLGTKGCQVFGVDVESDVVDTINRGNIHIEEPDL